ncbi:MAG: alpha/beta fold hydrolase [Dehalococcoidia bacterium]|nr:alpha/beta fold hydrolase [Dehalococcoidia bacterium]
MAHEIDFTFLDQPEILHFVFYPREDWTPPPFGARDYSVQVEVGTSISCRFYPSSEDSPSVLYFHGNGEVVYDYDGIAPLYNREGINLFVADYRGYGQSGGSPSFSTAVSDAHVIFDFFRDTLRLDAYRGPLFVMGRSLGSLPAVELACKRQEELNGLMVESGFASPGRFFRYAGFFDSPVIGEFEEATLERLRSITLPALIIHGEWDEIIPYEQAQFLYEKLGSEDKRLVTIPRAGHNDIMLVAMETYFSSVRDFVERHAN